MTLDINYDSSIDKLYINFNNNNIVPEEQEGNNGRLLFRYYTQVNNDPVSIIIVDFNSYFVKEVGIDELVSGIKNRVKINAEDLKSQLMQFIK